MKIRRAGFVFLSWQGDHGPRHVYVYRDGRFVLKWDLDHHVLMKGRRVRRVVRLISRLRAEGLL